MLIPRVTVLVLGGAPPAAPPGIGRLHPAEARRHLIAGRSRSARRSRRADPGPLGGPGHLPTRTAKTDVAWVRVCGNRGRRRSRRVAQARRGGCARGLSEDGQAEDKGRHLRSTLLVEKPGAERAARSCDGLAQPVSKAALAGGEERGADGSCRADPGLCFEQTSSHNVAIDAAGLASAARRSASDPPAANRTA